MSKITIDRALLEQALEWFEWFHNGSTIASPASSTQVMRTLRESLTQPQPVQQDRVAELEAANAELVEALLVAARSAEALKRECSMSDPESAQATRNTQYMSISYAAHAAIKKHGGAE